MKAIETLEAEHRVIEKVLTALDRAVGGYVNGAPTAELTPLIEFCRMYGDALHHEKEEHLLFPALARRGVTANDSSVRALTVQHETCRQLMREIGRHLEAGCDDPACRRAVSAIAREYIDMLRMHIVLEEEFFHDVAARVLTESDDNQLAAEMMDADERTLGGRTKAGYERREWPDVLKVAR
jgi:hemerythrin-like domain-containing protein